MSISTYSTLYRINLRFVIDGTDNISISNSDIVSISIINQYDTKTYPMFRLRLYSDITLLQTLTSRVSSIEIRGSIDGGIYKLESNQSPILISPTQSIPVSLKVYMEYKNTPTSDMDKYVNGIPKSTDLYSNNKVPIELYCYNYNMIHKMSNRPQMVYKNMNIPTVINSMLNHCGINYKSIDSIKNQTRYDQILIPNLSMLESLSFFDVIYGLYPKGGMVYGDIDKLYICDLATNNSTVPIPIYIKSYQSSSDTSGMMKTSQGYFMQTESSNVSVISESDIEKVLLSESIIASNVNNLTIKKEDLPAVKESMKSNNGLITPTLIGNISPEIIIHKKPNEYVASMTAARINEKITRVDISGGGFDITRMKPNTRYNLIFESPIRGMNMNDNYRASFICNTITPTSQELFTANTTMSLCKN